MNQPFPQKAIPLILFFLFFSGRLQAQLQCENDTTGLKALIDLQTGYYLGFQGGLYPYGQNTMPWPHFSAGMNISKQVLPLNAAGEVDWADGKVGFICLGASTAGNAFNHFKLEADMDTTLNPCLKIANCAVGAKGLEVMIDTIGNNWYWTDDVYGGLTDANLSRYQVEVAWIMVTSRVDSLLYWPYQPRSVADKYEALMPVLLAKFPNLKEVFISGFHYGGYADPTKDFYDMIVEPLSYWNNWSVKFVVERQIKGDPDLKYTLPGRRSPWITWGPHLWADGMRANVTDGLRWNCIEDYKDDGGGYHLSVSGKEKEGDLIYRFFKHSTVAAEWFSYSAKWAACDPDLREAEIAGPEQTEIQVFPNPNTGTGYFEVSNLENGMAAVRIADAMGNIVYTATEPVENNYCISRFALGDVADGVYFLSVRTTAQITTHAFLVKK